MRRSAAGDGREAGIECTGYLVLNGRRYSYDVLSEAVAAAEKQIKASLGRGRGVLVGEDALLAEIVKLDRMEAEIKKQRKTIEKCLEARK